MIDTWFKKDVEKIFNTHQIVVFIGEYKTIGFFAKKARGLMVRYLIEQNIETIDEIKNFDSEGYHFSPNLSTKTKLVFVR